MSEQFTDFELQVDLESVDAWGGEQRPLIPPGEYNLTVVNVKKDTSSNNNEMVVVEFDVADGDYAGQKVWNNYSLSSKAIGRLKSLVIACGATLSPFRASELMGQTILATVVHSEGAAKVDQNGNALPSKTFANVTMERAIETQTQQAAPAKTPPITQRAPAKGNAVATTGAPRRT